MREWPEQSSSTPRWANQPGVGHCEKRVKYNDLVANTTALHNVVAITHVLRDLAKDGQVIDVEGVAALSPFVTGSIKRFGDYVLRQVDATFDPFDTDLDLAGLEGKRSL